MWRKVLRQRIYLSIALKVKPKKAKVCVLGDV
jgi:hypothetical protein